MDTEATPQTEVITVNWILDKYERECLPQLRESTQQGYRYHIRDLRIAFGSAIASELRPKDFGPFINVRKAQTHRVRQLAVLSAAFTQAVSFWYVLDRNVLRDVKRPKSKPRTRLIADEEFEGCKAIAPKRIQLAMQLALITGQRQSDILRFKWADIKELPEPIWDERAREWITMELDVLQSKTEKLIGIGISSQLEAVLDECYQLEAGGRDGAEYVLPTMYVRPYTPEGFRACWQKVMKKWMRLGNANFHFHDIRALCATRCPSPEYAQKLLGHADLKMTMSVYRRGKERVMPLHALVGTGRDSVPKKADPSLSSTVA